MSVNEIPPVDNFPRREKRRRIGGILRRGILSGDVRERTAGRQFNRVAREHANDRYVERSCFRKTFHLCIF